jgi:hypothetical protein
MPTPRHSCEGRGGTKISNEATLIAAAGPTHLIFVEIIDNFLKISRLTLIF